MTSPHVDEPATRGSSIASGVIVDAVRAVVAGHPEVRVVVLFGSHARGTARPDSDIDLATLGAVDISAIAGEVGAARDARVDVVALETAGYPLLKNIVRDAVVLYERTRGDAAAWRSWAWLSLETDRPWFERMCDAYLRRLAAENR